MSYSPTVKGDVTGATADNTVVALQNRPMAATLPTLGQALVWNGAAWAPGAVTATQALAASLILRPGGVASGSVFTTWATLYTAFLTTDGPVDIIVDSSLGAATVPAGAYAMAGRATLYAFSAASTRDLLTVADGAVFTDLAGISSFLTVTFAPSVVGNIPLVFNSAENNFRIDRFSTLQNLGSQPLTAVGASTLSVEVFDNSTIDTTAATTANGVFASLGATGTLHVFGYDSPTLKVAAAGFASGPVGAHVQFIFDASSFTNSGNGAPASPGLGTPAGISLVDNSQFVGYQTALVAPHPPAIASGQVQGAIDTLNTRQNEHFSETVTNAASPYTIDAGSTADQTIFSNDAPSQYNLPLASSNPGRELTFKDITGNTGGLVFQLNPNALDKIETLGTGDSFQYPTPYGSITIKSDGANTWWII